MLGLEACSNSEWRFDFHFLSYVQSHITASRRALEAFLTRYPLCYGYWKKFADLERRAGYNDKAQEVKLEKGFTIQCWFLLSPF